MNEIVTSSPVKTKNSAKVKSGVRYAFDFTIRSAESDGQQVACASKSVVGLAAARCLVGS